jgi:PPOX class probable F420-dependent enzyme
LKVEDDGPLHLERLAAARVGHLATATIDGRPHVVPLCFAVVGETIYSLVDDKPKRTRTGLRRLRNLEANPRASLIVDHYEEDWGRLWYLMVEGEAGTVSDPSEYQEALSALRGKYSQYRTIDARPGSHPIIRIRVGRVVSWQSGS